MQVDTETTSSIKILVGGAALFIIIFGMKMSASILSPILLAVIVGNSVAPATGWLRRKGVPDWLALLITIVLVFLGVVGLIALIGVSVGHLVTTLPQYQDNLQGQVEGLQTALANVGLGDSPLHTVLGRFDVGKVFSFFGSVLGGVVSLLSGLVIMLMVLIFLLLAESGWDTKLRLGFLADNPTLIRFRELGRDLRQYVGITTWINFLVGLINTVLLMLLGVDYAALWGLLSFLMGYIPSVGFWAALVPPFLLAFLEFGTMRALIVLVGYIVINGGVQNFVEPRMMGAGLNLSPLVVVLSLFFWAWVLGPMGALLAIPLTLVVKNVFLDAHDETRGLAMLMSASAPAKQSDQAV